jgi:hypothetical protein
MKHKKTIRRFAQDLTGYTRRMSQLHCWAVNRLEEYRQREGDPEGVERQRVLASLTNWQHNKLMRAVGGNIDKHSPEHLRDIVSTFKKGG